MTSDAESLEAVFRHTMGEEIAAQFTVVLAGDAVQPKTPAPGIYLLAAERLGMAAQDCVVIES